MFEPLRRVLYDVNSVLKCLSNLCCVPIRIVAVQYLNFVSGAHPLTSARRRKKRKASQRRSFVKARKRENTRGGKASQRRSFAKARRRENTRGGGRGRESGTLSAHPHKSCKVSISEYFLPA